MSARLFFLMALGSIVILSLSCGTSERVDQEPQPTPIPEETIEPTASNTVPASDTPEPTGTATAEPTKTLAPPSSTPTPSHPVRVTDDFSSNQQIWYGCEVCEIKGGKLHLGQYPVSGADQAHIAVCDACGEPANYRMAVDVTYQEGINQPGRGYGFLVKPTDEYAFFLEISIYQDVFFWKCDNYSCKLLDGKFSSRVIVIPEDAVNRLEVELRETGRGTADIYYRVNDRDVLILWNQPSDSGFIGLELWGHALEVAFDNFEFEELEPYGE